MKLAFSYLRFSTKEQQTGDSERRQTDLRDRWLATHKEVKLDTSLDMNERGKSAYSRSKQSFKESKFGQFVQHVESGRVPPGSYLLARSRAKWID